MNKKASHTITDSRGLTYTTTDLNLEEAIDIIQQYAGKEINQFSKILRNLKIYLLNDGRVLFIANERDAVIYDSYAGFLSSLQSSNLYIAKHIPNTYPVHHIHYLKGGRKLYYDVIDEATARELVQNLAPQYLPWGRKQKLYYLLPDGSVIPEIGFAYAHKFASFQDFADYEDFRLTEGQAMSQGKKAVNQMCGRNPYGEQFPEHVEELCQQLPALLNAPAKVFDYSPNSLSKLDRYLFQHLITDYFADEVFLPLLAYAGAVNIKHKACSWYMFYDEVWDSWVPDIQTSDGRLLVIYNPLLDILNSWEEPECPPTLRMLLMYPPPP